MSKVCTGEWAGRNLFDLMTEYSDELIGSRVRCDNIDSFPLLIKFLDACEHLSIQVHPDDRYVQEKYTGQQGKTEMWYVLDAEPDARLVIGLKDGITPEELSAALARGEIIPYLNELPVQQGDALYIPAGTVHAILKGVRLAEIQQNSDITYRIYDWGRTGLDGKPRALHIEEGLKAIDFHRGAIAAVKGVVINAPGYRRRILVACPHFAVEELVVEAMEEQIPSERFEVWMVIEGQGILTVGTDSYQLNHGETWVMPAGLRNFELSGQVKMLKIYLPDLQQEIIAPLMAYGYSREDLQMIGGLF